MDDDDDASFTAATSYVASFAASGDIPDDTLLQFYGYYKQATEGPCTQPQPSVWKFKERTKWSAWQGLGDMAPEDAQRGYTALLTSLKPDWADTAGGAHRKQGGSIGPAFSSLAGALPADEESNEDMPPLIQAVLSGNINQLQQALHSLSSSASVDERDEEGCTALHWAADKGLTEVIELLVAKGADLDARDADGQTPLHYAALASQQQATVALLGLGADRSLATADGETAKDLAPATWDSVFHR